MTNKWNSEVFEKIHEINESRRQTPEFKFKCTGDVYIASNKVTMLAFSDRESRDKFHSQQPGSTYFENSTLLVLTYQKEDMYYIQDSRQFVGNSMLFWRYSSEGYTTDLEDAAEFTYEDAKRICDQRDTDKMWKVTDLRDRAKLNVDMQSLRDI